MNQNVVFTGALRDSFFLRQRFSTMCLVVLMIAALQGCDVNRNVSGEMPANVDEAVAEVVIVQPDLDRPHSVDNDNSAGSPTVVVAGVESGDHQQEEGKSPDLSNQLPAEPATDAVKDLSEDDSVLSKAGKLVGDAASQECEISLRSRAVGSGYAGRCNAVGDTGRLRTHGNGLMKHLSR